jgi:hypothetical protein
MNTTPALDAAAPLRLRRREFLRRRRPVVSLTTVLAWSGLFLALGWLVLSGVFGLTGA